jgi:hypothetical protein
MLHKNSTEATLENFRGHFRDHNYRRLATFGGVTRNRKWAAEPYNEMARLSKALERASGAGNSKTTGNIYVVKLCKSGRVAEFIRSLSDKTR